MLQQWLATFPACHAYRTIFAVSLAENDGIALAPPVSMPSGAEVYRGYAIHWDTISRSDGPWNAKAGVLCPADSSGFCNRITAIIGCRFKYEAEARDYVLRAARSRIEQRLRAQKMIRGSPAKNDSSEQVRLEALGYPG
jgi:hypothetical protein